MPVAVSRTIHQRQRMGASTRRHSSECETFPALFFQGVSSSLISAHITRRAASDPNVVCLVNAGKNAF